MEITAEMRRAVYAADCTYWGHQPDFRTAFGASDQPNPNDQLGFPLPVLRGPAPGQLPHVRCTRCGSVWLVIDEPGADYDDAVTKVALRMRAVDPEHTGPLTPNPAAGVGQRIPLAPGVEWDALPPEHPAVLFAHQEQGTHLRGSHTAVEPFSPVTQED